MAARRAKRMLIPDVSGTTACSSPSDAAIAVIDIGPHGAAEWAGDDEIAALSDLVDARCRAVTAVYEAAYLAAVALDPDDVGRYDHPLTLLDEAALDRYSMGVAEGLRLGLMVGLARGLKLIGIAQHGDMPPYQA